MKALEHRTIVRDDDADPTKPRERAEQSLTGRDVEVVRRFVEQQNVRLTSEHRADLPALSLTRRERRPTRELAFVERESALQLHGQAVVARRELVRVVPGDIDDLRTVGDCRVVRANVDRSFVRHELSGEHAQQRCLPCTVRADQAVETRCQHERHVLQYGHRRRPRDTDAARLQHGHVGSSSVVR